MTNNELVANALEYLNASTCYEKGFWCQKMTQSEYDRILKMYPNNSKYGNQNLINSDVYAADCICFVKQLLAGGKVGKRLSYAQMASNPVGDCTNLMFYDKLYDCCNTSEALPGYGLATSGHAALYVGNGQWLDFNFSGDQNGIKLHTGFSGTNFKCGKIPGVSYESKTPVVKTEKEILLNFCEYLVSMYLNL